MEAHYIEVLLLFCEAGSCLAKILGISLHAFARHLEVQMRADWAHYVAHFGDLLSPA